jgi:hypothetical protein
VQRPRRNHTPAFKAQVALDVLRGEKTEQLFIWSSPVNDLVLTPAKGCCATTKSILPLRAFHVLDYLPHRRLADIQVGVRSR